MHLPIDFKNIFFSFNQNGLICADLTFSFAPGKFISLVGASGIGKTTLLRLMMGLLAPQSGSIIIGNLTPLEARMRGLMAYAPQRGALCSWRTALGNVKLAMELTGVDQRANRKAKDLLEAFGLRHDLDKYPFEMSGGMQQRTILAMALGVERPLIFLDEPFISLDAVTRMSMYGYFLQFWQRLADNTTVVMVSHDINEAAYLSDLVYVLAERPLGKLVEVAVPLPKPRKPSMRFDPAFLKTVKRIEEALADLERNGTIPITIEGGSLSCVPR
jgi:putative hydroxymethylpyrimidine transport system ATP-binding protein